jgi:hypothetical protein
MRSQKRKLLSPSSKNKRLVRQQLMRKVHQSIPKMAPSFSPLDRTKLFHFPLAVTM